MRDLKTKTKGNLLIFLTAFFWSFLGVATKFTSTNGIIVTGVTSLCALILIRIFFIKHKLKLNKISICSGTILAGVNLTFFMANKLTTVTNTIVLQYSSPIFVLIISILFLKYKPAKKQIGILIFCMLGMAVFFSDQFTSGNMTGNILALISGILFAVSFILNAMPESDPSTSMIINHFVCFSFALVYALFSGQRPVTADIGIMIITGVFFSGFASIFYSLGMKMTTALNANMIALSEVFMAPLWALILFHENLGKLSLLGILMMISSIILESYLENKLSDSEKTGKPAN